MKAMVRAATESDIGAICSLLHTKMNPKIPLERWHSMMAYTWLDNKPDYGRVVDAEGRVLGYCGMLYADRMLGKSTADRRMERVVSMTSWYLDKSLRGMGLGRDMLIASVADPTMTYATLTNSPKPLAIQEAVGLRVLEDHRYVWHKTSSPAPELIADIPQIVDLVPEHERIILNDMLSQPLTPYLLRADGCDNLLYFSVKRKAEDVLWYDLMYASDLLHFSHHAQRLADTLLPDTPSVLAADGRFVVDAGAQVHRQTLPVPRYYKSERVQPHEVDHLYSELQLLDLKLD